MRGKDLLEKMELADEKYIQAANMPVKKKKTRKFFKAAAIILAVGGISLLIHTNYTNINISTGENFSKYSSLNELLAYLGENENHENELMGTKSLSANVSGVDTGSVMYNEYRYRFGRHDGNRTYYEFLQIFNLKEGKLVNTVELEPFHDYPTIFVYQNKLILAGGNSQTAVNIYSLDNPENPVLEHRYIQNGAFDTAFISDDKLYIFTSDGMCACGFSSKSNPDDYKPSATLDEKEIEWTDDEITIIGEPERVFYNAVSVMDLNNTEILQKRAFYGDIQDMYIDKDIIMFHTQSSFDYYDKPKIDTFDMSDNFSHISQITINALSVTRIHDIKKIGSSYKIIAQTYYQTGFSLTRGYLGTSEIVAISADIQTGNYYSKKYIFDYIPTNADNFVREIIWNENTATLSVERRGLYIDNTTYGLSVTFNDNSISFEKTEPPQTQTQTNYLIGRSQTFEYDGKKFYIDYQKNTLETVP